MDGYDVFIHRKNGWVEPGRDGVALNMDMEKKAVQWEKMEEIMRAARDRFMNNDVPMYTVMAEAMVQINDTRNALMSEEENAIPNEEEIKEDKSARRAEDENAIREMNL